mgnify:CR=1 FL=1
MSRIQTVFQALNGRKALIPYVTAGDPDPDTTLALMHGMAKAGADIIELGVPFSDPMADGPTIQRAAERALAQGVSLNDVLAIVRRFRETNQNTPVVLMGYLNPVHKMGYETFARAAAEAGVDGVLTVDSPVETIEPLQQALQAAGLDCIFLVAPTTGEERIAQIAQRAGGFVYYVSLKGVTGSAELDTAAVAEKLAVLHEQLALTGLQLGGGDNPTPKHYAELAAQFEGRDDRELLQTMLLRSMQQAVYEAQNQGHFGLAYEHYTHFTSPIRRYPDLAVHRAIKAVLAGKNYREDSWPSPGAHASFCERRADEASRDVENWLKTYYMRDKVGETFTGRISGMSTFGIFVTLDNIHTEGMVHVSDLGEDYFNYRRDIMAMVGERSGIRFDMGDSVTVRVVRADLETSRIDLTLVSGGYSDKRKKRSADGTAKSAKTGKNKRQPESPKTPAKRSKKQPEKPANGKRGKTPKAPAKGKPAAAKPAVQSVAKPAAKPTKKAAAPKTRKRK